MHLWRAITNGLVALAQQHNEGLRAYWDQLIRDADTEPAEHGSNKLGRRAATLWLLNHPP
ncbi:hypothetical protein [Thioalkalivibrio sp.]|uniref:hypothetical protein n=1 Tax=Thioalkalivibrio sp. TaxID=2093813 RepID=UPI0012D63C52|nr:hypothetical protein [Thioalkalivibrio sp.]TVP76653.1 MAG: hypothetical protein EA346_13995 [Thioalkalivibrio sp.]